MGEVLEMRIFPKTVMVLVFFSLLQGCGNDGQKDFYKGLWEGAKATLPSEKSEAEATEKAAIAIVEKSNIDEPLILATTGENRTLLIPVSKNGDYEQWHAPGKLGFTFKDGVLTATRGLGGDLMDADVEESIARIKTKSSQPATRVHRYLSGVNTIIIRSFVCIIAQEDIENTVVFGKKRSLSRVSEICTNSDTTIENLYWVDPSDGFIWKTEQWISTHVGVFTFERAQQ
ncbi:YjbF family lipoprotein [Falsihalocynthiibacter sp. S25ZX9]|uniref:YjbF family lipoprotein n=1 Tax=Falsihalocynthiibacter sp. S25ZX9 TaxID=3240870 RepID=UPI00350FE1AA